MEKEKKPCVCQSNFHLFLKGEKPHFPSWTIISSFCHYYSICNNPNAGSSYSCIGIISFYMLVLKIHKTTKSKLKVSNCCQQVFVVFEPIYKSTNFCVKNTSRTEINWLLIYHITQNDLNCMGNSYVCLGLLQDLTCLLHNFNVLLTLFTTLWIMKAVSFSLSVVGYMYTWC